jgi:hypothetical protein
MGLRKLNEFKIEPVGVFKDALNRVRNVCFETDVSLGCTGLVVR